MTRIVQLANFYGPESGGLRVALEELGRGYVRAGHDRTLIVPGGSPAVEATDAGVGVTVPSPRLPGSGYRVLVSRQRVGAALEAARPERIEVSDKLTLGWVGRWAAARGIPSVLLSHERIDAILAVRVPGWFPLAAAADHRNRELGRAFGTVVCTSLFGAEEFRRAGVGNVARVPLGVDLDVFGPYAAGNGSNPARLVCVGRLSKEKRPRLAVEALRLLSAAGVDAHLTIAGAGPMLAELRAAAAGLPVTFLGHVSDRRAVAALLAGASVAIAPCPVEAFGLSVLEALAAGTPTVVSDGGASGELIDPSCGRAVPPDPAAIAGAVAELLALPRHATRLAARSRAEQYPWDRTVAGMLAVHSVEGVVGVGR